MRLLSLGLALLLSACAGSSVPVSAPEPVLGTPRPDASASPEASATMTEASDLPPAWASGAIWYQIFPERFRNGDLTNDPTPESMEGSWPQVGMDSLRLAGWEPTPWTWDWYDREPWAERLRPEESVSAFYFGAQLRRFGGDLQGIIDGLPYLDALGINAIYLNPINDSPSLHKYDARTFRHVDPHFGPDPTGDKSVIATENPTDPASWQFTAADQLFLNLLQEAHARDIRVVLDYSWNHTGKTFWAFQDVLAKGQGSPYADWYRIDTWDDPATPENEFSYSGWAGVPELPEFYKVNQTGNPHDGVPYDGDLAPEVREHIFAVSRRWMDPNGDGDPSDGVDGFRLDVAEMVPLGFWRDYREVVKAINPEAILVGEIWWQQWPNLMMPPAPYLGDVFDSVMNYRPFAPIRQLLAPDGPMISPEAFAAHIDSLHASIPPSHLASLMTMSGSHDTPRLATTLYNAEVPYKNEETPRNRPGYRVDRPNDSAWRATELYRLLQIALPGAPHVFYGDEAGMWGADDPDERKPMVWSDLDYAPEAEGVSGPLAEPNRVEVDEALLAFTRDALALRSEHADLFARGELLWYPDNDRGLLMIVRTLDGQTATVVLNLSDDTHLVPMAPGERVALVAGSYDSGRLAPRSGFLSVTR